MQDGIKCHFLCSECEDRFGVVETEFSKRIFHPYTKNYNHSVEYDEYFLRFATSCVWRVLEYQTQNGLPAHFRGRHQASLENAKENWRKYLLCEEEISDEHSIQCLPVCGIIESKMELPDKINRFYLRSIGGDVACSDLEAFTYVKLGPFQFFGLICYPDVNHWVGTRISKSGVFEPTNTVIPAQFGEYIHGRAARYNEIEAGMSEKQKDKIYKSYEKNQDRALESETLRAMLYEEELKSTTRRSEQRHSPRSS